MARVMRSVLAAGVVAMAATAAVGQMQFVNNLMPLPKQLTVGSGALELTTTFAVETPGVHDERLMGAIGRMLRQVELATGLPHEGLGVTPTVKLVVNVQRPGEAVQSIDEDESYQLKVTSAGAEIDAATDVGAMHGLATLVQLIQPYDHMTYELPQVTIDDSPRFRWRGLMIDCGRHFEPIDVLKRNIDAMAALKMNVFHWHLTEDQGFRIQSMVYPDLTAKGSDGLFYTQAEAKDLVAYARARGIRVVPEFEMPGHSAAWLYAYPELASGTVPESIRRQFGVSQFAIDPTREETYVFMTKFLTEMTTIFPDAYFHIGGDETPAPDWKVNPRILAFMKAHNLADNEALQAYYNTRILTILTGLHKHMVGWDEIMTPSLPKDIVVQSWRGIPALAKGAKMGFQGILSAGYYLDGMLPASNHYLVDPIPADTTMTPEEQKLILGGETPMWGEHTSPRDVESRIWPRAAAIAERFWSARDVRDVDDMYRRLAVVSIELERGGLQHLSWEDQGLRELIGSTQIDALRTFASYFEPVSFGTRSGTQHTNQLSSLSLFVDAVTPDPPSKHWSDVTVRQLIANPGDAAARASLEEFFSKAAASVPEVKREMETSPRMNQINIVHEPPAQRTNGAPPPGAAPAAGAAARPARAPRAPAAPPLPDQLAIRADQLVELSQIGREALMYFGPGKKAPAGWKAKALATIAVDGSARTQPPAPPAPPPAALVSFTFLDPLKSLVNAVQE